MATLAPTAYRAAPSPRRRTLSLLLAAGIVALIVWALIRLGVLSLPPRRETRPLDTFDVTEAVQGGAKQAPTTKPQQQQKQAAKPPPPRAAVPPPPPLPVPNPQPATPPVVWLSHEQFAASDVGRYHSDSPGKGTESADAGDTAVGPGQGPHGERLYNAEWYRRPRDAEMTPYLPHTGVPPNSWAMVACRTIANYHVEDCEELAESPPGSHLSRSLRQAAWQFLVRPPRIDGKPQIGTWVRIRFDWTDMPRDIGSRDSGG